MEQTFQKKKKSKKNTLIFLVFTLFLFGIIVFILIYKPINTIVSPIPQHNTITFTLPFFHHKKDPEELKKQIEETIHGTLPQYSILVKDFNSDFVMNINKDTQFTAASVNKVPILATLYYLSQKGTVDLSKNITIQQEDIQDYGTGSIRYDPPGTVYDIRILAKLMMQQSDNTAAFVLGRYVIGFDTLQKLIDSWGLSQTDMENNTTSNADMAFLLEKMYREKVANKQLTAEMLTFLTNGTIEDRIPAGLPKGTLVYHKTGNGVGMLHDVGIVVGPKAIYYIGLFTSQVPNEENTITLLASISRVVYDFMNK
jgi:beta-lactamase class A